MYKISQVSTLLNVHPQTLRRWEREGKITPSRTANGQRRYKVEDIESLGMHKSKGKSKVIYCRVSSRKQSEDLKRQTKFMQSIFPNHEVISDISSGVNFKRPGLQSILERLCKGDLDELAIAYKDRLCRIGFEIFEKLAEIFGCKIIVVNNIDASPEEELVEDLIAITTSFSARMHGLRKYGRKMRKNLLKAKERDEENIYELDEAIQ